MNVLTAIRMVMALVRVLKVNLAELAAAYKDADACQQDFDGFRALVNAKGPIN